MGKNPESESNAQRSIQSEVERLRAEAQTKLEANAIEAFATLARASALSHSELKANCNRSQFVDSFQRIKDAYSAIRELNAEFNAARSLERVNAKCARFGVNLSVRD